MKKQLFIARPVKRYSAALVTSLILIFGIFDAKANDKSGKANSEAITYVGLKNNILTFNVNYLNQTEEGLCLNFLTSRGIFYTVRFIKTKK